ncbi:MAG: hypothetical protein M1546_20315 [Chloroflexi bacterium]|nr:hypothetical protein [Chloroflexota bacterium]
METFLLTEETAIWRFGSLLGGGLGLIATVAALRSGMLTGAQRLVEVALLALFCLLVLLSFVSVPIFGLRPILVEAIVNVGVVVLGVQFAWEFFAGGVLAKG